MAGGYIKDGGVQEQIDASLNDEVTRIRNQLPHGESASECDECDKPIPEARQKAVPGVRLCVVCQEAVDAEQTASAGYNRRGSKDSQLR